MPYIYKIINDTNGKMYVGKTDRTIRERWNEHLKDSSKERCEKRPLYDAMNKYGIEHFSIELIEECLVEQSEEREIYWISFYNTCFGEGYNATQGGDGKHYVDYDLIVENYFKIGTLVGVNQATGYAYKTIRKALKSRGIKIISSGEHATKNLSKKIRMYDLKDNFIRDWDTLSDAGRWIQLPTNKLSLSGIVSHIGEVCKGKRKTAYGYKWKFTELSDQATRRS